ncbi:MAG: amidohydrolase [Acidobacteria bacterium]|nr:amidohydrolase [Acidobacteriota bacterium]
MTRTVPGMVIVGFAILLAPAPARAQPSPLSKPKASALAWVDANQAALKQVSDDLWSYSEIGLREIKSHERLTKYLEAQGFTIQSGIGGMPTAFVATYGSGRPIVGFLAEYDALPGTSQEAVPQRSPRAGIDAGQACGHNLYGTASVAAAIAAKEAMASNGLAGTIRVYGTPAEETLIGKIFMFRAGVFDDLDAAFSWHPGDETVASYDYSKALVSMKFRFQGRTAHASTSKHDGRSALDAVELMNVGANYLREHVKDDARIHYVITDGGGQPNVVPARAEVWYYVRADKHRDVERYFARLDGVAKGAAQMTETTVEKTVVTDTPEILPNRTLAELVDRNLRLVGPPKFSAADMAFATTLQSSLDDEYDEVMSEAIGALPKETEQGVASNDQGVISWSVPIGRLTAATYPLGTPGHSWQVVAAVGHTLGQPGMIVAAKTLALSAVELLADPKLVAAAKRDLEELKRGQTYNSLLPAGQPAPTAIR